MDRSAENSIQFILRDSLLQYRELFLARLPVREYPTGHIFNMVGLPVGTLYFLAEGSVEIYTANRYGYVRLIGIHEVNTLFNLDSLSGMGSQEAVITARAATPVRAAPVTMEELARLAEEAPGLWQDLLVYVGNVLRLMCYDAREQTIRDVTTRLIHFLLLYTQGKEVPEVDCSQQQIASAINASRVQVTRVCARLQAQGLIRIRRGHIRILDPETLEQLSERREAGERE